MSRTPDPITPVQQESLNKRLINSIKLGVMEDVLKKSVLLGADGNACDEDGTPAVILAANHTHYPNYILALMRATGDAYAATTTLNTDATDPHGRNALFYLQDSTTMSSFAALGADPAHKDKDGMTALEYRCAEDAANDARPQHGAHLLAWLQWIAEEQSAGTLSLERFQKKASEGFPEYPAFFAECDEKMMAEKQKFAFPFFLRCMEEQGQFIPKDKLFSISRSMNLMQWTRNAAHLAIHCAAAGDPVTAEDISKLPHGRSHSVLENFILAALHPDHWKERSLEAWARQASAMMETAHSLSSLLAKEGDFPSTLEQYTQQLFVAHGHSISRQEFTRGYDALADSLKQHVPQYHQMLLNLERKEQMMANSQQKGRT